MLIQVFFNRTEGSSQSRPEKDGDEIYTRDSQITYGKSSSSLQHAVPVEKRRIGHLRRYMLFRSLR